MNEQHPPQPNMASDFERGMNIMMFVVHTWAVSMEVFLHRNMGSRYLGFSSVAVVFLIPMYGAYWEHYDLAPLMRFLAAYVLMAVVSRMIAVSRQNQSVGGHSYYNGYPRMMRDKSRADEVAFKHFREPFVVGIIGLATCQLNQPLGWYWMLGAVSLFVKGSISNRITDVRIMDMNDAMIEQAQLAERFRTR
jgi:hypothetical protein